MVDFVARELFGLLGWVMAAAITAAAVTAVAGLPPEWSAMAMTIAAGAAIFGRPRAKAPCRRREPQRGQGEGGGEDS